MASSPISLWAVGDPPPRFPGNGRRRSVLRGSDTTHRDQIRAWPRSSHRRPSQLDVACGPMLGKMVMSHHNLGSRTHLCRCCHSRRIDRSPTPGCALRVRRRGRWRTGDCLLACKQPPTLPRSLIRGRDRYPQGRDATLRLGEAKPSRAWPALAGPPCPVIPDRAGRTQRATGAT